MKQKKDGKKVQNWHKPYNPKYSLGQRAYKLKNERVSLEDGLDEFFKEIPSFEFDDYWNSLWNPMVRITEIISYPRNNWFPDELWIDQERDFKDYSYNRLFELITTPNNPVLDISQAKSLKSEITNKVEEIELNVFNEDALELKENLEELLYGHIKNLSTLNLKFSAFKEFLNEKIGSFENIEIVLNNCNTTLAKVIVLFANFWMQTPISWKAKTKNSLAKYIFSKFDAPDFLIEPPTDDGYGRIHFKWICWYIIIGQGGSLKKAANFFDWNIPSKFQHFLRKVPRDIQYPMQACVYAEVLRLGGSHIDFIRITNNESLMIDPTENSYDKNYLSFWRDTIKWLIDNGNQITNVESNIVITWAVHLYTESERDDAFTFSWKGRGLVNTLNQARQYHESRFRKDWGNYKWKNYNWNWEYIDESGFQWAIEELTSSEELFEESMYMQHCVKTYSGRCVSGTSAILSLKQNDQRKLTIEVAPRLKSIVQALGKFNRRADKKEKEVVKIWAENVLKVKSIL